MDASQLRVPMAAPDLAIAHRHRCLQLLRATWPRLARLGGDPLVTVNIAWDLWVPLALDIAARVGGRELFVQGVVGPQGSGKSTLAAALVVLLDQLGLESGVLSLDDLYLGIAERDRLRAAQPSLVWRGPPGTHDIELGLRAIAALRWGEPPFWLPRFDKSAQGGQGERFGWVEPQPGLALAGRLSAGKFWLEECRLDGVLVALPASMGHPVPLMGADQPLAWYGDCAGWQLQGGCTAIAPDILPTGWQLMRRRPAVLLLEGWFVGAVAPLGYRPTTALARFSAEQLPRYGPLWQLDGLVILRPQDPAWSRRWRWAAECRRRSEGRQGMEQTQVAAFVDYFHTALPWLLSAAAPIARNYPQLLVDIDFAHAPVRVERVSESGLSG